MGFWNTKDVAAAKITKQELIEVEQSHDGEKYVIPRLVLHVELLGKVTDLKSPEAAREPLPAGAYKTDKVMVNFWDVDDRMKRELLAQALEILAVPDDFSLADFKANEDGSAPNINFVGREVYLKASVKPYNGRESVYFNLHRFLFGPGDRPAAAAAVPASTDVIKRFHKNGYVGMSAARQEERARFEKLKADKGGKRAPVAAGAATGGTDSDIPF